MPILRKFFPIASFIFCAIFSVAAYADSFTILLVDKAKNQIHLANYGDDRIQILKSYHATLGKALGDKKVEKDLKTPEGIYFFTTKITQPHLKKKFGRMALLMDYPNPIDRMSGKTGYDIMLHATDDPSRLKRDLDSEGCVVIDNAEIEEISKSVTLGLTPIVIYPELKTEHLETKSKPEVKEAFDRWLNAWRNKDIETYASSYVEDFRFGGMNLKKYREYKNSLNQRYSEIKIAAENIRYFYHPKYDVVAFNQNYTSKMKNGAPGFQSSGTKWVYFVKDSSGKLRIANESFTQLKSGPISKDILNTSAKND